MLLISNIMSAGHSSSIVRENFLAGVYFSWPTEEWILKLNFLSKVQITFKMFILDAYFIVSVYISKTESENPNVRFQFNLKTMN